MKPHGSMTLDSKTPCSKVDSNSDVSSVEISGERGERAAFARMFVVPWNNLSDTCTEQDNESTPSSIAMPSNQLEESAYMQTFKQFAARDKQEQAVAQAREKIYQDCLRLQKQKYDERKARVKDMVKLAGRDLHRYPELLTLAIKVIGHSGGQLNNC